MSAFEIVKGMRAFVVTDCAGLGRVGFGRVARYDPERYLVLIALDDGREIYGWECWWLDGVQAERDLSTIALPMSFGVEDSVP
jgi:hypothetical protein